MQNIEELIQIVCGLKPGLTSIQAERKPEEIFGFNNKAQMKTQIKKILSDIFFGNGFDVEKIKRELRCNWYFVADLDGLKSVNFFGNHQ